MTVTEQLYSESFYAEMSDGSQASARYVVPIIQALFSPSSVVDVGCGIGDWLAEFRRVGVTDIAGLDGPWVRDDQLLIPPRVFNRVDLGKPFKLDRRFDLAMCVEVAEHIPQDGARDLVASLTSLAPVIVFSAAVPGQTGTNHVNEQWPSYWTSLFAECGYSLIDCLRPRLWTVEDVEYWYVQNMLVFVNQEAAQTVGRREDILGDPSAAMLDLVHPRAFLAMQGHIAYLERELTGFQSRSTVAFLRGRAKSRLRRIARKVKPR
jgi:SAM-dependent methyltransferase